MILPHETPAVMNKERVQTMMLTLVHQEAILITHIHNRVAALHAVLKLTVNQAEAIVRVVQKLIVSPVEVAVQEKLIAPQAVVVLQAEVHNHLLLSRAETILLTTADALQVEEDN